MKYNVGDKIRKEFLITEKLIKDFCDVSGDNNPIHTDDKYAQQLSLKKRIAPGLLLGSLIASVIGNDFPGPGTIYLSQTLKFTFPAYVNDQVIVQLEISEIKKNNWLVLKTSCTNQCLKKLLVGESVVMIAKDQ